MHGKASRRAGVAVCLVVLAGTLLTGCGHQEAASTGAPAPPSNAKMGSDYAQGMVSLHGQQGQAPRTAAAPNTAPGAPVPK